MLFQNCHAYQISVWPLLQPKGSHVRGKQGASEEGVCGTYRGCRARWFVYKILEESSQMSMGRRTWKGLWRSRGPSVFRHRFLDFPLNQLQHVKPTKPELSPRALSTETGDKSPVRLSFAWDFPCPPLVADIIRNWWYLINIYRVRTVLPRNSRENH